MAYKFKRYKIKWSLKRQKVKRRKIDRRKSRRAYQNFIRHKAKMLATLRKNRLKIKRKASRNKNAGMYKKLAKARKRFKHLLKNSLEYAVQDFLFEEKIMEPEVEITEEDLEDILDSLDDIDDIVDDEETVEYISTARDLINNILDGYDPDEEDEKVLSDILRFIDIFYKIQNEEE